MRFIHGMTLIELVIVLAVSAILLSIAYPMYVDYSIRARRAEAISALQVIALAQERFYAVQGRYATQLIELSLQTAWQPGESEYGFYRLSLSEQGDNQSFVAMATAVGVQTQDIACQQLWLNHLGQRSATDQAGSVSLVCW
jgi:type IV pilus assembly protein PilE